jgi:CBS domain containing-hemolysin-like protein
VDVPQPSSAERRVHQPLGAHHDFLAQHRRNNAFFDVWSLVHVVTGIAMGWMMDPFVALLIMVLWEPLEILVLSPFLARFGILFGHESLKNSLSDVLFDAIGVALGYWALTPLIDPPFVLF